MAKKPSEYKQIFHLTSLENIDKIIKKGLLCRNKIKSFEDIADSSIILEREKMGLNDYVPFHFFPRTPFDGTVLKKHRDKDFVYIAISKKLALNEGYKVIPNHPCTLNAMEEKILYDYSEGYAKINWDLIDTKDYSDEECKLACMAECLFHEKVPCEHIDCYYVPNEVAKNKLIDLGVNERKILVSKWLFFVKE